MVPQASTNIRYCYYSETHKILGSTYGMLVLQASAHGLQGGGQGSPAV